MKVKEEFTAREGGVASREDVARRGWGHGLLGLAAVVYGVAVVLSIARPSVGVASWWLLGTVAGLAVLGLLVGAIRGTEVSLNFAWGRGERDLWAEQWRELMGRPVR